MIVIKSGLEAGDQVVVAGAYALKARLLKSQIGDASRNVELPIFSQNRGPIAEAEARRKGAGVRFVALQKQIRAQGGASPMRIAVHPLFLGESYRELRRAGAGRIVSSNTIRHRSNTNDVTELLATAIASQLNSVKGRSRYGTLPRPDEAEL